MIEKQKGEEEEEEEKERKRETIDPSRVRRRVRRKRNILRFNAD